MHVQEFKHLLMNVMHHLKESHRSPKPFHQFGDGGTGRT